MSRRRSSSSGVFTVGSLEGSWLTIGAAISRAITLIERGGGDRQVAVYESGERVARVRRENGTTYVEEVRRDG